MTLSNEPLAVRESTDAVLLREGVPASVEPALRAWIFDAAKLDEDEAEHALIRLNLVLPPSYWQSYRLEVAKYTTGQAEADARQAAARQAGTSTSLASMNINLVPVPVNPHVRFLAYGTPAEILWYVADDLLRALCTEPLPPDPPITTIARKFPALRRTKKITTSLRRLLEESRSVYEIAPDNRGLQRRLDREMAQHADQAETLALAAPADRPLANTWRRHGPSCTRCTLSPASPTPKPSRRWRRW